MQRISCDHWMKIQSLQNLIKQLMRKFSSELYPASHWREWSASSPFYPATIHQVHHKSVPVIQGVCDLAYLAYLSVLACCIGDSISSRVRSRRAIPIVLFCAPPITSDRTQVISWRPSWRWCRWWLFEVINSQSTQYRPFPSAYWRDRTRGFAALPLARCWVFRRI